MLPTANATTKQRGAALSASYALDNSAISIAAAQH
jgi:hypothetical protein